MPSTSLAKNIMAKALREIIDRPPSARRTADLWAYFENRCCYCGVPLDPSSRRAHLDHLESAAEGGRNSISNMVLACATCNGDLKRQRPWREFLREMCPDPKVYSRRLAKIRDWLAQPRPAPHAAAQQVEKIILRTTRLFDEAVAEVRRLRVTAPNKPLKRMVGRRRPPTV